MSHREAAPVAGARLTTALAGAELKLVDVGARGEPRPELMLLAPFAHLFAFEPDADEAARLATELSEGGGWRGVTVIPAAVAREEGSATLYETSAPGMSSLLEPDPAVYGRYDRTEAFEVMRAAAVPTIPLDLAAQRHGFQDACFVKLDTQGTELEILMSGEALLQHVAGIYTEALFQPFYKGQSLFADIDAYLRARGFVLMELRQTSLRGNGFPPDRYSERQVTWAHCLYLRDPSTIRDEGMRLREIAVALAYHQNDLAFTLAGDDPDLGEMVREHVQAETRRRLHGLSARKQKRLLQAKGKR